MIASRLREEIERRSPRWERWLQDLIRLPSTFESEHAVVDYVAQCIAEFKVPLHFVAHDERLRGLNGAQRPLSDISGRRSVVCKLGADNPGRSLILNAHLDVVPAGDPTSWTHPPFSGFIDNARHVIFGRGAVDDKAGVTILLALIELLSEHDTKPNVTFQFVLDDETSGNGTLLCLADGWTADAAMIVDGTRPDRAVAQHAGQLQFSITVKGKSASVSVSHLGVNAAEILARALLELYDAIAKLNEHLETPWNRFPSPFQFVVQRIFSEGETLTVPDRAEARCYVTFPPPATLATMRELLTDLASGFRNHYGAELELGLNWDGFCAEPVSGGDAILVEILQATARDAGTPEIEVGASTGTSDMRHFAAAGIPCLLYGPGTGYNPHRADEHYFLTDLSKMVAFYLEFIRRWCGRKPT